MGSDIVVVTNRHRARVLLAVPRLLLALSTVGSCLALSACKPASGQLIVGVVNDSGQRLSGLEVVSGDATRAVGPLRQGETRRLALRLDGRSGDVVRIYDAANARAYVVHPYFEGGVTGQVDVNIDGVADGQLSGVVRVQTEWYKAEFDLRADAASEKPDAPSD